MQLRLLISGGVALPGTAEWPAQVEEVLRARCARGCIAALPDPALSQAGARGSVSFDGVESVRGATRWFKLGPLSNTCPYSTSDNLA
jgi:hypothetical protein